MSAPEAQQNGSHAADSTASRPQLTDIGVRLLDIISFTFGSCIGGLPPMNRRHHRPVIPMALVGRLTPGWYGAIHLISMACTTPPPNQALADSVTVVERLSKVPTELYLADSSLHLANLFKLQVPILIANDDTDSAKTEALVEEVYAPFGEFWRGYLGDETAFRAWVEETLLGPDHPLHTRWPAVVDLQLDGLFEVSVRWLVQVTNRAPQGTWYMVFGPGWTDMGGLGELGMVADFSSLVPEAERVRDLLPHELMHMVHDEAVRQSADPWAGTVLHRVIAEGLGVYAAWVYADGTRTPAQSLGYTEDEWARGIAHEAELLRAARELLASRARADINRLASRSDYLLPDGPPAAGYFLGFRMVQAYVERHGAASWPDVVELSLIDVRDRSGYFQ